ncbi:recombinase RecT [Mycobacterium sp. 1465703.0]|uniref:recombinase RecT n=1 Tax=Mycobacterium sp. 1465703.0 TaxID=1834078 RepID=UPI0007FD2BDB|nr:recombinase RecT [Mycobacterium sp. 1465703.0]OBI95581.1 hypothetical protein A5625_08180 [Mycobacterium sp. 1465703.0]
MTNEVATIDETTTDLVPGQIGFNSAQRAMLAQLGLSDAPEGDLILFSHVCQKSGLDPFRREIYMIGRNTQVTRYEKVDPNDPESNQRKVTRWETVYTIQTGIQGFRKRARELAEEKGNRLGFEGPFWCGDDGEWREVWPEDKTPVAAKYVVFRDGEPIPAVTHFAEYVQTVKVDGNTVPNSMWSKMPRNQIAKCAEALAIQRAYPDELSGLVLEDAVSDAITVDEAGEVQQPKRRPGGRGVDSLRARAAAAQNADDPGTETVDNAGAGADSIPALFAAADCNDVADRFIVAGAILGRTVNHAGEMSDDETEQIRAQLVAWRDAGELDDKVRDALNEHDIKAEQAAGNKPAGANGKETK